MDNSRFQDNLSDYVDGRLTPADKMAMDAHVAASPKANAEVAALRETWDDLGAWAKAGETEPPMFFRDNVMSAVERTGTRRGFWGGNKAASLSVWERLFPHPGRLALAAGMGGLAAIAGFLVATNALIPGGQAPVSTAAMGVNTPKTSGDAVLPGAGTVAASNAVEAAPRLMVTSGRTLTPDALTVCDFSFWIENAPRGSAKFVVLGNNAGLPDAGKTFSYPGMATGAVQTLRIPYDGQQNAALALEVKWTATGTTHERYLFVPTAPPALVESSATAPLPAFNLAEMPLVDALKQVAIHTNTAITLEETPNVATLRARIYADGKEPVAVALRRALEPLGLQVARSPSGILVSPRK